MSPDHDSPARRPRIVLADDYPGLLVALRRLLEGRCDVIATVSSGVDAVNAATTLRPDAIVLDLTMADLDGLEACRLIKQAAPRTHVILLTATEDPDVRAHAFQCGASAFVLKRSAADELEGVIETLVGAAPSQSD